MGYLQPGSRGVSGPPVNPAPREPGSVVPFLKAMARGTITSLLTMAVGLAFTYARPDTYNPDLESAQTFRHHLYLTGLYVIAFGPLLTFLPGALWFPWPARTRRAVR